jgi:hypothetical protein
MRDHAKLRELWSAGSGGMQERLAAVNAVTELGPRQPIRMSDVRECLVSRSRFRALQVYSMMARTANLRARLAQPEVSSGVRAAAQLLGLIEEGAVLQVSQFGIFERLLDDICADSASGVTLADASALWALSETVVPWWKTVYGRPISTFDLIEAQLAA